MTLSEWGIEYAATLLALFASGWGIGALIVTTRRFMQKI